jgi:hypothetical protein
MDMALVVGAVQVWLEVMLEYPLAGRAATVVRALRQPSQAHQSLTVVVEAVAPLRARRLVLEEAATAATVAPLAVVLEVMARPIVVVVEVEAQLRAPLLLAATVAAALS